jgi:hypothetical protein
MEAAGSSETLVTMYMTVWRNDITMETGLLFLGGASVGNDAIKWGRKSKPIDRKNMELTGSCFINIHSSARN